jgi:hypothetical protein
VPKPRWRWQHAMAFLHNRLTKKSRFHHICEKL